MTDQAPLTTQEMIRELLSPEREQGIDPFVILTFMPIEPYDTVADIGCGPGYFSIPLAKHLVYGKLYALDIDDEMLDALRRRVSEANLGNVEILRCGETEFPVPKGSLDGAFLAFVVHASRDPVTMLKAVGELLKPNGWCTVLEWYRTQTEGGPPLEKRIGPEQLEALAREAGFRPRGRRDINGRQYMAMLRKQE